MRKGTKAAAWLSGGAALALFAGAGGLGMIQDLIVPDKKACELAWTADGLLHKASHPDDEATVYYAHASEMRAAAKVTDDRPLRAALLTDADISARFARALSEDRLTDRPKDDPDKAIKSRRIWQKHCSDYYVTRAVT
ncbi:hypothetical protein [Streptomyces boluensis]|uniref:Uncharacterized protein n=1 Tax=Streptomyces boluensis TaxID=1775135 RepID=A0A964XIU7_9ACTN|nr:hypothetical protein [Streptomyces boluensis]NBE50619.1 hypothetical protein [Streptomyces boluensis]